MLKLVLALCTMVFAVLPIIYWWNHDSLTWVQLFKEVWHYYAIFFVLSVMLKILDD